MQNLLEVKDLKMHFSAGASGLFGGKKNYVYAVDGVNFTLKKGETLGLVGGSGCGSLPLHAQSLNYINPHPAKLFLTVKI